MSFEKLACLRKAANLFIGTVTVNGVKRSKFFSITRGSKPFRFQYTDGYLFLKFGLAFWIIYSPGFSNKLVPILPGIVGHIDKTKPVPSARCISWHILAGYVHVNGRIVVNFFFEDSIELFFIIVGKENIVQPQL